MRYIDIKKFYPSIPVELALSAWRKQADLAGLASLWREVGEKILTDHAKVDGTAAPKMLTGPMISHLIANLVLREFDAACSQGLEVKYLRYVDDITLVGTKQSVTLAVSEIRARLGDMGLKIHGDDSPKSIQTSTAEWLTSRDDFHDTPLISSSWMTLIGDLKRLLMLQPESRDGIKKSFQDASFRLPVYDYHNAVHESSTLERMQYLSLFRWFRRKSQSISIDGLLFQANELRSRYHKEFLELLDGLQTANSFQRKRSIPKLRYRAGRLIYLATAETLKELSEVARKVPELHFHAYVMNAVVTGNVDEVLSAGTNAAQAAAQPLRAMGATGYTTHRELDSVESQSLAVFLCNGVHVTQPGDAHLVENGLMKIAQTGSSISLMKEAEPFIREIACLHGITDEPRHSQILESTFDKDEELSLDAIEQLQQSVSP